MSGDNYALVKLHLQHPTHHPHPSLLPTTPHPIHHLPSRSVPPTLDDGLLPFPQSLTTPSPYPMIPPTTTQISRSLHPNINTLSDSPNHPQIYQSISLPTRFSLYQILMPPNRKRSHSSAWHLQLLLEPCPVYPSSSPKLLLNCWSLP